MKKAITGERQSLVDSVMGIAKNAFKKKAMEIFELFKRQLMNEHHKNT